MRTEYRRNYYFEHKAKELESKRNWRARNKLGSSLHSVWCNMISRCYNSNVPKYHRYGGRGIKVCESWRTFETFSSWALFNSYSVGLTVDRIDNDGDYKPSNCQFLSKGDNSKKQFRQRESESPNTTEQDEG